MYDPRFAADLTASCISDFATRNPSRETKSRMLEGADRTEPSPLLSLGAESVASVSPGSGESKSCSVIRYSWNDVSAFESCGGVTGMVDASRFLGGYEVADTGERPSTRYARSSSLRSPYTMAPAESMDVSVALSGSGDWWSCPSLVSPIVASSSTYSYDFFGRLLGYCRLRGSSEESDDVDSSIWRSLLRGDCDALAADRDLVQWLSETRAILSVISRSSSSQSLVERVALFTRRRSR